MLSQQYFPYSAHSMHSWIFPWSSVPIQKRNSSLLQEVFIINTVRRKWKLNATEKCELVLFIKISKGYLHSLEPEPGFHQGGGANLPADNISITRVGVVTIRGCDSGKKWAWSPEILDETLLEHSSLGEELNSPATNDCSIIANCVRVFSLSIEDQFTQSTGIFPSEVEIINYAMRPKCRVLSRHFQDFSWRSLVDHLWQLSYSLDIMSGFDFLLNNGQKWLKNGHWPAANIFCISAQEWSWHHHPWPCPSHPGHLSCSSIVLFLEAMHATHCPHAAYYIAQHARGVN